MARRLETAGIEVDRPEPERLSADDLATRREEQFLEAALAAHRRRAETKPAHVPGTCSNCAEPCASDAHYCDSDCRDDHQRRERALARR